MAKTTYKAFLSCSFAPEDEEINHYLQELINSFDIETEMYNYQEIGKLSDKLKQRIVHCDCVIAIATRRSKVEGADCWTCSGYIHDELAIANAYNKPVAVFLEEGVRLEGLIAQEERRQYFSRHDLHEAIPLIVKFLFNLHSYLQNASESMHLPLMLRHYLHVQEELSREQDTIRCEVLMECLAEALEAASHCIELEDNTPGLSVKPIHFDFACSEHPSEVKVSYEIVQNSDQKYLWKLLFTPPLHKGDKVKYAFKVVTPNNRPWTREELLTRLQRKTYEFHQEVGKACDWLIPYPTAEFSFTVDFPETYEIEGIQVGVKVGQAQVNSESETKRIKEGNMFIAEKLFDKWSLTLKVPRPLQEHTYFIYYVPPSQIAEGETTILRASDTNQTSVH